MKIMVVLVAMGSLFMIACNNNTQTAEADKTASGSSAVAMQDSTKLNGNWQLNHMADMAVPFDSLFTGKIPAINFDLAARRFSGNTGCNNFSGEIDMSGSTISFLKPMIMTKMFCQGNAEQYFTQNLQKINSWAISNDTILVFKAGSDEIMRFSKR